MQVDAQRGVDQVIDIMPRLAKRFPGVVYVVAGDGPDRQGWSAWQSKGVADRVVFLGRIPRRILDVYSLADVFIMVTRVESRSKGVEGFGIVFLEAGSQGIPVIGPSCGSADAIAHNETGFLRSQPARKTSRHASSSYWTTVRSARGWGRRAGDALSQALTGLFCTSRVQSRRPGRLHGNSLPRLGTGPNLPSAWAGMQCESRISTNTSRRRPLPEAAARTSSLSDWSSADMKST